VRVSCNNTLRGWGRGEEDIMESQISSITKVKNVRCRLITIGTHIGSSTVAVVVVVVIVVVVGVYVIVLGNLCFDGTVQLVCFLYCLFSREIIFAYYNDLLI
jgi:hypothetical protein